MKSQDIVILLKLVSLQEQEELGLLDDAEGSPERESPYSVRGLEASLPLPLILLLPHCKSNYLHHHFLLLPNSTPIVVAATTIP